MTPTAGDGASKPSRHGFLILVLASLTAFGPMSIDMYLPALPAIAADLGVDAAGAQMTLSTFFLGFGAGQLVYGPLADRFGRLKPLFGGLVLFTIASLGCAFAPNIGALILFRFLQALGGCAGPVLARAVVRDLYGRDRAARVLSLMVLIMSLAPLLAPLVGAQILLFAGWRTLFIVLAAFGGLCILATALAVGETLHHDRRLGGSSVTMILSYGALLTHRRYIGYAVGGALVYAGLFAYITGSPDVIITIYGVAPEHYGLIFGANVLGIMVMAAVNRRIVMRFGVDRLFAVGVMIAAVAGCALLAVAAIGRGGLPALLVPLFFFVSTIGMVGANGMAGCLGLFPERAGMASALAGTLQFVMGAVGSLLVGLVHNGTAVPMASVIAVVGVLSLVVQRWLVAS